MDTVTDDVLEFEDPGTDETDAEREARDATEVELDENSRDFVDQLVSRLMDVCDLLSGHPLRKYQRPFAKRIFESLVINDGATITALFSRQSGKSETVANVVATAMIMLPRLARAFPDWLDKYSEGVWVGAFAPVDEQADTLHGRIVTRLTSDTAAAVLADPDIDDRIGGRGRTVYLKNCGSLVRKTTAHPRASIEGRTYHIILMDEAQGADDKVLNKSVGPMGAATNATMIFTGTPSYTKGAFYHQIQINRRAANRRGSSRQNHFEADWRTVSKENGNYRKFVLKEMLRLGEDSDEFKLSYRLIWLLDKGMFTTSEKLDNCGDVTAQNLVHAYNLSPVVAGIDCARKQDRTIVTVLFVDWDRPDEFGVYHHRILNWLDCEGLDWEEQYFRITEFLSNYNVWKIGIDTGGLGDVVASRLRVLMPGTEIVDCGSMAGEQSERWKHLRNLIDRRQVVWPAGARVRRLKIWRRFRQEMEDLEILFKGPHVLAEAPTLRDAHDDYADSLAIGCYLTKEISDSETSQVEVSVNPFYEGRTRTRYPA